MERRDARGLTALMKVAVQGRHDCVTALLLAGEHRGDQLRGVGVPSPGGSGLWVGPWAD